MLNISKYAPVCCLTLAQNLSLFSPNAEIQANLFNTTFPCVCVCVSISSNSKPVPCSYFLHWIVSETYHISLNFHREGLGLHAWYFWMRSPSYEPLQLRLYFRQFFDGPKNFLFCIGGQHAFRKVVTQSDF